MRHLVAMFLCFFLLCATSVPVLAAGEAPGGDGGAPPPETSVSDTTSITTGDAQTVQVPQAISTTQPVPVATFAGQEPVDITMEMVGDVPYITRTYAVASGGVLPAGLDAGTWFEQDGYRFTRCESYSRAMPDTVLSRTETQNATLDITEDDAMAVLATAAPYVDYNEDGFSGRLTLDAASIHITGSGTENYTYRVTEVREYNALDRNDAAYIPKTVTKSGVSLALESVEWVVMGTTPTPDGLVPNLFKAIATYGGSATGSRVNGYTASFRYTGLVEHTVKGATLVSVVFRGEKIVISEPERKVNALPFLMFTLAGLAILGVGIMAFFMKRRPVSDPVTEAKFDFNKLRSSAESAYDASLDDMQELAPIHQHADWKPDESMDETEEDGNEAEEDMEDGDSIGGGGLGWFGDED